MDPASVAGIGLAVMSLAAQCFTGAMQAIQLISTARNLEPAYIYLNIRLRLEQQRLYNWSSEVGLLRYLEGDEDPPNHGLMGLSRSTILDTLLQIQVLVQDFVKSRDRFGGLVADYSSYEMGILDENSGDRVWDHLFERVQFLKKARGPAASLKALPKRLKWVTFYKDKYERLINQLREFNDVLIDLVDSDARVAIGRSTRETNTTILHFHSKLDDLCQLVKALSPSTLPPHFATEFQPDCYMNIRQRQELAALANFKAVNTWIHEDISSSPKRPFFEDRKFRSLEIARSDVHLSTLPEGESDRCEADYQPLGGSKYRVWIEWREYDPIEINADDRTGHSSRVEKLVALLSDPRKPELFRVPHCIGYFNESKDNKGK